MTRAEFLKLCLQGCVLDGATGTELAKHGMPGGVAPELWIYENPQAIIDVHNAYITAGSNIVYAPTFGGNKCKLDEFGIYSRQEEIIGSLMRMTKENAAKHGVMVFGDIAPTGKFVEPFGDFLFEDAVAVFRELVGEVERHAVGVCEVDLTHQRFVLNAPCADVEAQTMPLANGLLGHQ